jgi:hypothetical protein
MKANLIIWPHVTSQRFSDQAALRVASVELGMLRRRLESLDQPTLVRLVLYVASDSISAS